jgi:tRNA(fMet)-specific endonuclease VapC
MVKPRFLLDTNILSEPMCRRPNRKVMARLRKHEQELATACVVWHELLFGAYRLPASRRREDLEQYLSDVVLETVPILPYDESAAAWHACERARLGVLGRTPPFADSQIAAIAAVRDLVLVTRNVGDFEHFSGVRVDDWHA